MDVILQFSVTNYSLRNSFIILIPTYYSYYFFVCFIFQFCWCVSWAAEKTNYIIKWWFAKVNQGNCSESCALFRNKYAPHAITKAAARVRVIWCWYFPWQYPVVYKSRKYSNLPLILQHHGGKWRESRRSSRFMRPIEACFCFWKVYITCIFVCKSLHYSENFIKYIILIVGRCLPSSLYPYLFAFTAQFERTLFFRLALSLHGSKINA